MAEILEGQILELQNLMSFRGKVTTEDLQEIGKDLETKISMAGGKRSGSPITATYGMEGSLVDVEILVPIDRQMSDIGNYSYKKRLRITNALVVRHIGNPVNLQESCNELNQYIIEHGLVPITVGYNVTKKVDTINVENSEIDVYVGISPNIL